jgi:hypothetical protein
MSAKHTIENIVRNAWLMGLGSIESSAQVLGNSIDAAQEKSNNIYNELLTRGEEIQSKINDTKVDIEARGKKFIGIDSGASHEEKLAQLNATVDHLTTIVVKLIEKHNAASAAKQVKIAKKAKPVGTTNKAVPKAATAAKQGGTANKVAPQAATVAKQAGTANKVASQAATAAKQAGTENKVASQAATVAKQARKANKVAPTVTETKPAETVSKVAKLATTSAPIKAQ